MSFVADDDEGAFCVRTCAPMTRAALVFEQLVDVQSRRNFTRCNPENVRTSAATTMIQKRRNMLTSSQSADDIAEPGKKRVDVVVVVIGGEAGPGGAVEPEEIHYRLRAMVTAP